MNFEKLKAELPKKDKGVFLSDATKADQKADADAGGSDLFKGSKVRDIARCTMCSFPRIIVSKSALNKRTPKLSQKEKKQLLNQLEDFKGEYVCGDPCPVDGFETKRDIRCGDFVETQYFTFAKGNNNWSVDICCYCCNDEDLLSVDKMKEKFNTGGKQPLRLCNYCASLKIQPPTTNAAPKHNEKSDQDKTSKKRQREVAVSVGAKRKKA